MKKTFTLIISLCIALMLQAQVLKTVGISAGGLSTTLSATEKSTVTNLTVTGTIDARDFKTMRDSMQVLETIDLKDNKKLCDELGDVLLQVVLHSQIADDEKAFNIEDVAKELNEKLIRRHPHVFGGAHIDSVLQILDNWDAIKQEEKKHRTSIMDGISKSQSALMSAQKISKKAVKVGFEWPDEKTLYECVFSEFKEFEEACKSNDKEHIEEEMGDILFAVVNLARWNKIDAEQALLKANKKFIKRFKKMEELAVKPLEDYSFEEFDELWKQAKLKLEDSNDFTLPKTI